MVLRIKIGIIMLIFLIIFGVLWSFKDKSDPVTYNLITIEILQIWTLLIIIIAILEIDNAFEKIYEALKTLAELEEAQKDLLKKKLSRKSQL